LRKFLLTIFFDKVFPYEAVIPQHIFKEVAEFYHKGILPKTISIGPRIQSTIIKPNLAVIIANWIDKNDSTPFLCNKYKFNLIYQKSRDGFDCTIFNNKCNGQGPFVVLIKVQSKKIYGGYNPIGYTLRREQWEWLITSDSFIFSFENDQDIHNMKIGRVINPNRSIYEDSNDFFINFGGHLYFQKLDGPILYLDDYGNYDNIYNINYNQIEIIEEIEVFSVVKKTCFDYN